MKPLTVIPAVAATILALALAGCGGEDASLDLGSPAAPLSGARAQAAAPATAGALAQVADVRAARTRLGYVDIERLADAELPVPAHRITAAVLDRGAERLGRLAPGAVRTAIQVGGGATILMGPAVQRDRGLPRGHDGIVLGAGSRLGAWLADVRPERSAITPLAPSAVQSCLGDALAQTILGPATMGADAALGVGIAESADPPAGVQLRICAAPRLIRDIHATERSLHRRFSRVSGGAGRRSQIREQEIGEREIVSAVLAADALAASELLALLSGGPQLRALAWR